MSRIEKDDGLLLEGDCYFKASGTSEYVNIGNVTELSIVSDGGESKDRISHERDISGNALNSVVKPGKATISLNFDTFRKINLAMAVMGETSDTAQVSEAVVDQGVVITELNRFMQLGKRNIDEATVVVKDASDVVVDDSLVEVNPRLGFVMVKSGGTVNKGDTVKVSYSTLDKEGYLIKAQSVSSFKGEVKLDLKNLVNNKNFEVHAGNVTLSADGGINWLDTENYNSATMKGTASIMEDEKVPYVVYGEYADA